MARVLAGGQLDELTQVPRMQAEEGRDFVELLHLLDPPRQKVIQMALHFLLELGEDFRLAGNVVLREDSHALVP